MTASAKTIAARVDAACKLPREIRADAVYPLAEFAARAGWGKWAMRSARRKGLPVRKVLGRSFIIGGEFVEWLKSQGAGR